MPGLTARAAAALSARCIQLEAEKAQLLKALRLVVDPKDIKEELAGVRIAEELLEKHKGE